MFFLGHAHKSIFWPTSLGFWVFYCSFFSPFLVFLSLPFISHDRRRYFTSRYCSWPPAPTYVFDAAFIIELRFVSVLIFSFFLFPVFHILPWVMFTRPLDSQIPPTTKLVSDIWVTSQVWGQARGQDSWTSAKFSWFVFLKGPRRSRGPLTRYKGISETVMQTQDAARGLNKFWEFSQPSWVFGWG